MSDDDKLPSWADEAGAWDNYQTAAAVSRRAGFLGITCGWELTGGIHGHCRVAQRGGVDAITVTAATPGMAALGMAQLLTRAYPSALADVDYYERAHA